MREMRSGLSKPDPVSRATLRSELWTHIMSLMRVLKQIKRNQAELH